jgi:hypothetical protein
MTKTRNADVNWVQFGYAIRDATGQYSEAVRAALAAVEG